MGLGLESPGAVEVHASVDGWRDPLEGAVLLKVGDLRGDGILPVFGESAAHGLSVGLDAGHVSGAHSLETVHQIGRVRGSCARWQQAKRLLSPFLRGFRKDGLGVTLVERPGLHAVGRAGVDSGDQSSR